MHFFTDTKSHQGRALWIHPWRVNLEYQQFPSDYKYQVNEGMLWRIELGHSSWNGICPSSLLTGPHPRGLDQIFANLHGTIVLIQIKFSLISVLRVPKRSLCQCLHGSEHRLEGGKK